MNRVLVTGVNGFIGKYLKTELLRNGHKVYGIDFCKENEINNPNYSDHFNIDLHNTNQIASIIAEIEPECIIHLAGILKSDKIEELFDAQVYLTKSLLDAIQVSAIPVKKIVLSSSSSVYGITPQDKIITENDAVQPITYYGCSKAAQEIICRKFFMTNNLPIVIARTFNVIGPDQPPNFVLSDFAKRIANLEATKENQPLIVGNLEAIRDFIDVRDVVRAYVDLVQFGAPGETYNVCSGQGVQISQCLKYFTEMSQTKIDFKQNENLIQKNDIPKQIGSYKKLNNLSGWIPKRSLHTTLTEQLDYWRNQLN